MTRRVMCRGSAALVLVAGGVLRADDLVHWNVSAYHPANNGGAVTPLEASSVAAHVTATPITAGPGVNSLDPCGGGLSLTACAGTADMWVQYFSQSFDPADYFEFSLTPDAGYRINYQTFQIPMGILYVVDNQTPSNGRSTGPKTWELRYSLNNFATPGTTLWTGSPFPFSITGLPGQVVGASEEVHLGMSIAPIGVQTGTVTFRFYGYNAEMQHPTGPQGFGAGPTNRTYFGWPQFDGIVRGTITPLPCYVNCDESTQAPILNVSDFLCFLNRFSMGDSWANCDGGTIPPVLNIQDFACFMNRFGLGCS